MPARSKVFAFFGGALLLFAITAPFLWLKLSYDYNLGQVTAHFSAVKGVKFFLDLTPIFATGLLVAGFWILPRSWRARISPPAAWTHRAKQAAFQPWFQPALFLLVLNMAFWLDFNSLSVAIFVGLCMIQALGLNIAIGMTGLLVLGYAAFYAMGGYTFAILQRYLPGLSWWSALPIAFLVGGAAGWVVGLPCLRLRGDYLAIVTLGFGESFRELMRNLPEITGGDKGLIVPAHAKIKALGSLNQIQVTYLVVVCFVFLAVYAGIRIYRSWIGRAWIAIREDEIAAAAMGIPVVRMKLLAFALSASFASVAGVLYVGYSGFINPEACTFESSVMILAMVILGGLGSIPGVLLGAALLYLIPTLMRDYLPAIADYRLLLFGIIMVLMMIFRPQGLLGSRRHQLEIQPDA